MAAKYNRQVNNQFLISGNDAESIEYNPASGACKSLLVGPRLLPIPIAGGTWTTTPTTATALPTLGCLVYIYNNSGTVGSVTVGQDATVTAEAVGAFDANGNVGVACPPNAYTYLALGANRWIITSASTLIVYLVEDPTTINQQTPPLVTVQDPRTWLPVNS